MTEAGSRPGWRVTFLARTRNVTQRMRPCYLRHAIQSAVPPNSLCATRAAQTNGGKLENDATLSCGSVSRSLNRMPQAQPDG